MTEKEKINEYIQTHYQEIKTELQTYCFHNHFEFSIDAYHDTLYLTLQAVEHGTILNYDKIKDYIFLSYRRATIKTNCNKYDASKVKYNENDFSKEEDDFDDVLKKEENFKEDYNLLMEMGLKVAKKFGKTHGKLFLKRVKGEPLDIAKGERGKMEKIKSYLREEYKDYSKVEKHDE